MVCSAESGVVVVVSSPVAVVVAELVVAMAGQVSPTVRLVRRVRVVVVLVLQTTLGECRVARVATATSL